MGAIVGATVCNIVGASVKGKETVGDAVASGGREPVGTLVGCDVAADVGTVVGTEVNKEQEVGQVFKFVKVFTANES